MAALPSAGRALYKEHRFYSACAGATHRPIPLLSRSLELKDFSPLPSGLNAHVFDFSPDVIEVRHVQSKFTTQTIRSKHERRLKAVNWLTEKEGAASREPVGSVALE